MSLWLVVVYENACKTTSYLYVARVKTTAARVRTVIYHILYPNEMFIRPEIKLVKCSKDTIRRIKTQHVLQLASGHVDLIPVEY